jgi:beta-glucosidase
MRFRETQQLVLVIAAGLILACGPGGSDDGSSAAEPAAVNPGEWPQLISPVPPDPEIDQAVEDLLAKMSVEDKVGQVIQPEINSVTPEEVKTYRLGSVLNGGGGWPHARKESTPADWLALADAFWEASMDTSEGGVAIPIIWGLDAVHGHGNVIGATLFPHNVGLGAANDPGLIREIGRVTAREVAVTGQDWDFGPTIAVARDDRWGRTYESYSEDPEIVSAYAAAMVEGFQGAPGSDDFLDGEHLIACAKHFLGDGGTDGGTDQGDNLSSEAELREVHGAGYVTALEAGVQTVMVLLQQLAGGQAARPPGSGHRCAQGAHGLRRFRGRRLERPRPGAGVLERELRRGLQRRGRHVHGAAGLEGAVREHPGAGPVG